MLLILHLSTMYPLHPITATPPRDNVHVYWPRMRSGYIAIGYGPMAKANHFLCLWSLPMGPVGRGHHPLAYGPMPVAYVFVRMH